MVTVLPRAKSTGRLWVVTAMARGSAMAGVPRDCASSAMAGVVHGAPHQREEVEAHVARTQGRGLPWAHDQRGVGSSVGALSRGRGCLARPFGPGAQARF